MKKHTGQIPFEIKSSVYLGRGLFLYDLLFIVFYALIIMDSFKGLVNYRLQIPYLLFNVVIALLLTRPSRTNHGKKVYHSLIIYFLSRKNNKFIYQAPLQKNEVKAYETTQKK